MFASKSGSLLYFMFLLFSWVLLKKKAGNKILLNVNVSTSFTLFSYILCIFVCGLVEKTANSKQNGERIPNCSKYRVNIILDDKTLQYFHVLIAYQIQPIIYKTMGLSILVSIFEGA